MNRTCERCGASYTAKTGTARYCIPCAKQGKASGSKSQRHDWDAINRRIEEKYRSPHLTVEDVRQICKAADTFTGPEVWEL